MRSEAEIREAIGLCEESICVDSGAVTARDATVEALRFALGIDDASTSPMSCTLKELIDDIRPVIEARRKSGQAFSA